MRSLCAMAGLVGVLGVSAVQAQMQVTLYQDLSNYSYSDGGEFSAVPNPTSATGGNGGFGAVILLGF
jgi:hypothetical protein